jgi:anthranilate phosphoribosyltransferase
MHEVIGALLSGDASVSIEMWHSFWDCLQQGAGPDRCEKAVAMLASLIMAVPDKASVGALVESLDARRDHPPEHDAVNIVGTGGGPSTFNMSTAAAFLAAALGVRVVKSGARAYTSRLGSIDVLELLGVPLVRSHEATAEALDRHGIAFAGSFVYPPELTLLAKNILPVEMKTLGRFFNSSGPFLAAVPARCQVTGVSDPGMLPLLEHLAANHCRRSVWLCFNRLGVDELVSFAENVIRHDDGTEVRLSPSLLGLSRGTLADLRPAAGGPDESVRQFMSLLEADGPTAAVESICLNAASLVVASGLESDWDEALRESRSALEGGHALALLERLRAEAPKRSRVLASHG